MVGEADHLVFEGPPEVTPPLAQDATERAPAVTDGRLLDTRTAIPDLTAAEKSTLRSIWKALDAPLAEKAAESKRRHIDEVIERLQKKGETSLSTEQLRDRLMQAYDGRLAPEFPLEFDDPRSA